MTNSEYSAPVGYTVYQTYETLPDVGGIECPRLAVNKRAELRCKLRKLGMDEKHADASVVMGIPVKGRDTHLFGLTLWLHPLLISDTALPSLIRNRPMTPNGAWL